RDSGGGGAARGGGGDRGALPAGPAPGVDQLRRPQGPAQDRLLLADARRSGQLHPPRRDRRGALAAHRRRAGAAQLRPRPHSARLADRRRISRGDRRPVTVFLIRHAEAGQRGGGSGPDELRELDEAGVPLDGGLRWKKASTWALEVRGGKVVSGRYLPPPPG